MKTKTLIAVFALALSQLLTAQEHQLPNEKEFNVYIRTCEAIPFIYYEHKGPYNEAFNNFGQLMKYIQQNNIATGAFSVGIYYDDPSTVAPELLRSEAGFSIKQPVKETEMFKCKTVPSGKAVCVRYTSMDEIVPAYEALEKYISENQLKTAPYSIELYYGNDPTKIDAEILMFIQ
jgi:effector-binding domain-containing protein